MHPSHYHATLLSYEKLTQDKEAEARAAARMLGDLGQPLIAAKDLAGLRVAFETLSGDLTRQVRGAADQVGNAYLVHCPMAFNNKGASWLSPKPEVLNPYFADRMLHCGSVRETLSIGAAKAAPPPEKPHVHPPHPDK